MSISEHIESALNRVVINFPSGPGAVSGLQRLSGGASQEIWAFDVDGENAAKVRYILRRAPDGQKSELSEHTIPLGDEARLVEAVGRYLNAAPKVAHICVPEDELGEGFIMAFVPGETIARKILRDPAYETARKTLAADCGAALGAIHAVPVNALPTLPSSGGLEQLVHYDDIYRAMDTPRPVFELAFQALKSAPPAPLGQPVLVHGDFRLGNLIVGEQGLSAVLDWELAHMGDPREDLAWICVNSWRFGQSHNRVGGFGDLHTLLEAYADAGGPTITPPQIDWWEMLGSLKWGIMCMIMYERYRTGGDPSVERAAIGRRVSETEIDLIGLIETVTQNA